MLLALLVYSYATGVFSSRKIERATHDSVAFRFISANQNPDHEALATFRWWFLKEIEALFVEVKIEARVEESYVREQADYQAKLATREEKIERTGKSARGKIIRAAQGGRSDQPDR